MVFDNSMIAPGANYSAEEGCFEGPEKLLEIWFSPVIPKNENANLRQIERHVWDDMLATVKCTVLSIIRNPHADAYLLSESSMFVYPHKLMIKTCGATTLLSALPRILEIAQSYCGYHEPYRLFYSRKSFMFPEKQVGPHRSWDEEVNYLDSHFEHGSAYTVGDTNGDEWYLYMTTPTAELNLPAIPWPKSLLYPAAATTTTTSTIPMRRDETIEILMTQLNPEAMEAFYHRPGEPAGLQGGRRVDLETGLAKVYPDAKVDSYLFEPCGYSANALLDEGYYTIHVTPEPQCSYASFETTIPASYSHAVKNPGKGRQHGDAESVCLLIRQVIDIFQPGTFTVTYFSSHNDNDNAGGEDDSNIGIMMEAMGRFGGYKRKDRILYEFDGYDLVFGQYKKI